MTTGQVSKMECRVSRASVPGPGGSALRVRLVLATGLFVIWLGYLLFLVIRTANPVVHWWPFAITKTQPIILSRPQFLVSPVVIIAEVKEGRDDHPGTDVTVTAVARSPDDPNDWKGKTISVTNLPVVSREEGWQGPGEYILPLLPDGSSFRIAPLPSSPGFDATGRPSSLHIYPVNPQTQRQLEEIQQSFRSP